MAKSDEALDRVRKQLRSVLISEKHGVAVERIEGRFQKLRHGNCLLMATNRLSVLGEQ